MSAMGINDGHKNGCSRKREGETKKSQPLLSRNGGQKSRVRPVGRRNRRAGHSLLRDGRRTGCAAFAFNVVFSTVKSSADLCVVAMAARISRASISACVRGIRSLVKCLPAIRWISATERPWDTKSALATKGGTRFGLFLPAFLPASEAAHFLLRSKNSSNALFPSSAQTLTSLTGSKAAMDCGEGVAHDAKTSRGVRPWAFARVAKSLAGKRQPARPEPDGQGAAPLCEKRCRPWRPQRKDPKKASKFGRCPGDPGPPRCRQRRQRPQSTPSHPVHCGPRGRKSAPKGEPPRPRRAPPRESRRCRRGGPAPAGPKKAGEVSRKERLFWRPRIDRPKSTGFRPNGSLFWQDPQVLWAKGRESLWRRRSSRRSPKGRKRQARRLWPLVFCFWRWKRRIGKPARQLAPTRRHSRLRARLFQEPCAAIAWPKPESRLSFCSRF